MRREEHKIAYKNKEDALEYYRNYYIRNREKKLKQRKNYYEKNRERLILEMRKYYKEYSLKNKEKISMKNKKWYKLSREERLEYWRNYDHEKRKIDKQYVIKKRLRCRLNQEKIRYFQKNKCYFSVKFQINFEAIMECLKPFPKDISKFHIDHIKPLCSFDLTNPEQIKIAFAPENHQWLLAEENSRKGKHGQENY